MAQASIVDYLRSPFGVARKGDLAGIFDARRLGFLGPDDGITISVCWIEKCTFVAGIVAMARIETAR